MTIPTLDQLAEYRDDQECYFVAEAINVRWPILAIDAGYYVHPDRGPGDHSWNIAPDGTIIDLTAAQHDYDREALNARSWGEDRVIAQPDHPEVIASDHPFYSRYLSWERHPDATRDASFATGWCPSCGDQTATQPCAGCGYGA